MENRDGFIPKEDIEFERELREQEREEKELREKLEAERRETEEKERAEYEKNLQDKKIELVKLRQGVIESSDVVKEVHEEPQKLTLGQKISGVWYRSKWLIIFIVVVAAAFAYIIYDSATAVQPDFTVLAISDDTALYYRTVELEEFIESFADDINGDGKVNVMIYNISTDYSDATMASSNQVQLMSQLMTGENVIVVSDNEELPDFEFIDFRERFPDDEHITERGLLLSSPLAKEKLKWEAMPDSLFIGIRSPEKLLATAKEQMQAHVDDATPVFERIRAAVESGEE